MPPPAPPPPDPPPRDPPALDLAALRAAAGRSKSKQARVRRLGRIVECATALGPGGPHPTALRCPKRPNRRACKTPLQVWLQEVPPVTRWRCPGCDDAGAIAGWAGEPPDLRGVAAPGASAVPVSVREPCLAAACQIGAGGDRTRRAILARARLAAPAAGVLLSATPGQLAGLADHFGVMGEMAAASRRQSELLLDLAMTVHEQLQLHALRDSLLGGGPPRPPRARAAATAAAADTRRTPPEFDATQPPWVDDFPLPPPSRDVLELKIQLDGVEAPPWRCIAISADATLLHLAGAVLSACDWYGGHLWEFFGVGGDDAGRPLGGLPDPDYDPGARRDAAQVPLTQVLAKRRDRCMFLYDFGDSWEHVLTVTARREHHEPVRRLLLDGALAFPREDSGSIPGFERARELCRTGRDPWTAEGVDAEETAEYRDWLGDWDPDAFDLEEARHYFDAR